MSDVQETTAAPAAQPEAITIPTGASEVPTSSTAAEPAVAETAAEKKDGEAVEKAVEPITEGQLSYKGPGLLKSLIPSKRDFWLSDSVDSELDLSSYMRGEKPDVSHPVAAWASQTSKGLLFFNKKGDTNHHKPGSVLPLYDATDLRKQSPHEISFRIAGHDHTLKAATDAERDGWYISLEKAVELSKASKESIQGSEGYKAKIDELSKPVAPTIPVVAAAAAAKKSSEADKADEAARPISEDSEGKKNQKSRSTSRGVFDRLRGKKEEHEQKKEEEKADKEEDKKTEEGAEVAAAAAGTAAVAGAAVVAEEDKKATEEPAPAEEKTEEKPKAAKRASIFGSLFKSQPKEKEQKEAEPTEEVKDGVVVAENPPQLPEAATAGEVVEPAVAAEPVAAAEEPKADAEVKAEEPKTETATPNKDKKNFLSSFSFKRGRSVSPSAPKEASPKPEATEESAEVSKAEEPAVVAPAPVDAAEKPEEATEETNKTETTPTANKRQSIISSFGRRASHMLKGRQAPKDTAATSPTAEEPKTESAESGPVEEPAAAGEAAISPPTEEQPKPHIGDVVPEAVNVGQPQSNPAVTASA